jgi:acyl-CoA thioester hydrolase
VLHHARYIELAERGYLDWMKCRNLSFRKVTLDHNVTLVVYDIAARYRAAVQFEEEVQIVTRLQAIDRKGLDWKTLIMKGDQVSFSMLTKMACVDIATKTIISVPDFLVSMLVSEVESSEEALQPVGLSKRVPAQFATRLLQLDTLISSEKS